MIKVENLTKYYGNFKAVNSINFEVNDGEILGFLGPNGAGKTTTLRIITSYLAPSEGNIYVDDMNVIDDAEEIRKQIGYLPELNPLYDEMRVYDFLNFVGKIRKVDPSIFESRLNEVIELCGLRGVVHKMITELSKGYRQRVGLAQAIIHDPKILILDEPTTGLDPNQIVEIRELIKALGKKKTLIISSHILQEIQATADRMIIINKGDIVANGTIEELMSSFKGMTRLTLELKDADKAGIENFASIDSSIKIGDVEENNGIITTFVEYPNSIDPRSELFKFMVEKNWTILEMSRHKTSLEDVFRNLTVEGGNNEK